jgi:hypothetical protein
VTTSAITQLTSKSHLENAIRGQSQTIITGGQKIVQSYLPSQYTVYQHKTVPIKQFVPPTNLIADQIPANLIVKTLPQGPNSPQINFISTSSAPHVSDIINTISPVNTIAAASSTSLTTTSPSTCTSSATTERSFISSSITTNNIQQISQDNITK